LGLSFSQVQAAGLVPCGGPGEPACQLCHLFVMFDKIIDFVLINLIPPLAVLMLVIGGVMFIFAAESPTWVTRGKSIMTSVVIGLIIIYAAWLIIGLFFQVIGLTEWTKEIYKNWWEKGFFEIPCGEEGVPSSDKINNAPIADADGPYSYTHGPYYSGVVNQPVIFNGSGSWDPDGDDLIYEWDFGDNTTGSKETPTHIYTEGNQIYTVTLVVKDGKEDSQPSRRRVFIFPSELPQP